MLVLVIIVCSCHRQKKFKIVKADVIEYRIEYLDDKAGSVPTQILPDHMSVIFAPPYAINRIQGFFGQFSLSYVANLRRKTVITLLKLFDRKYYYEGRPGDLPCGIDPMEGMVLSAADGEKVIAGYRCREYILNLPGEKDISVYSTDEIRIKSPNITTPYHDLENVLLQFYTRLSVMDMLLVADTCKTENISEELFSIPDGYVQVSKAKMENILAELFK